MKNAPDSLILGLVGTETVETHGVKRTALGGAAAYVSMSAHRWGLTCAVLAHGLPDPDLPSSIEQLEASGGTKPHFEIGYDTDLELRQFSYDPGAWVDPEANEVLLSRLKEWIQRHPSGHLHICPLPPSLYAPLLDCLEEFRGTLSIQTHFDGIVGARSVILEVIDRSVASFLNRQEARILTETESFDESCARLSSRSEGLIAITEPSGVDYLSSVDRQWHRVNAAHVEAVDPTGAGDVFAGTTVTLLLSSIPEDYAVAAAVGAAGLSVKHRSTAGLSFDENDAKRHS